jgi:hypothetical protein
MKKIFFISIILSGFFLVSACEEKPSEDWKEKDGAAEKQLQLTCEGFKESDNWDCDCFKKVTKEMFPDLKEFYKMRENESQKPYADKQEQWFAELDKKCKQKDSTPTK